MLKDDFLYIGRQFEEQSQKAVYDSLVKNISKIHFSGSSGYSGYRRMIYVGPKSSNSLVPIAQDEEGYINIAAGTYGKGKFLVFPWIEKYLKDGPPSD